MEEIGKHIFTFLLFRKYAYQAAIDFYVFLLFGEQMPE
jgi:hypothetical protein